MLNYTICKVDIPFYSCQFSIDGPSLNGHNVTTMLNVPRMSVLKGVTIITFWNSI